VAQEEFGGGSETNGATGSSTPEAHLVIFLGTIEAFAGLAENFSLKCEVHGDLQLV
jgi:hypothetical protein